MTARYTGMDPRGPGTLSDASQLQAAIQDIVITPLGSRIMRRDYGSLLPDLLDSPQNAITRLQCMSAAVIALTRWEPRIAIRNIDLRYTSGAKAELALDCIIIETMQTARFAAEL
ncbi:GPW/gp25 family protein [Edwardsiella piscicida]|uniref:GPW/gp25 family protein n=1 Tax=Edwardsiella piscicida TaxID=1263550 RepID=UPI00370DD5DF